MKSLYDHPQRALDVPAELRQGPRCRSEARLRASPTSFWHGSCSNAAILDRLDRPSPRQEEEVVLLLDIDRVDLPPVGQGLSTNGAASYAPCEWPALDLWALAEEARLLAREWADEPNGPAAALAGFGPPSTQRGDLSASEASNPHNSYSPQMETSLVTAQITAFDAYAFATNLAPRLLPQTPVQMPHVIVPQSLSSTVQPTADPMSAANGNWPVTLGAQTGHDRLSSVARARLPLDSTRSLTLGTPRYKTALRAAGVIERERWMTTGAMRLAGLALLALAFLVSLGCASQPTGIRVERAPLEGSAPAAYGESRFGTPAQTPTEGSVGGLAPSTAPGPSDDLMVEGDATEFATSDGEASEMLHTVVRGDTLFSLAREYFGDASMWRAIADANGLTRESTIRVGQTLRIPGSSDSASTTPAAATRSSTRSTTADVLRDAEALRERGQLREARQHLSAALYTLGGADETQALTLLGHLNQKLLSDTSGHGDSIIHVVQRGETLYGIARQHGCTWQAIVKLNGLRDTRILVGQRLLVLKGTVRLVLHRASGLLDLWLDDAFVKRYRVDLSTVSASLPVGVARVRKKTDAPAASLGSRLIELDLAGLSLHAGTAAGMRLEASSMEELFDLVLVGTAIELR